MAVAPQKRIDLVALCRPLQPGVVRALACFSALVLLSYLWGTEGGLPDIRFTAAVSLTVGVLIVLLFRRILLAAVLVIAMVALLRTVASIKQQTTDVTLHAYDVVDLLSSWSALAAFWASYPHYAIGLLAALTAVVLLGLIAYRLDATRVPRPRAVAAAAILMPLTWIAAPGTDQRRHSEFYYETRYVWFFFTSWSDTIKARWRGHLIEAAPRTERPVFRVQAGCDTTGNLPHIILIHQESVVPPFYFPSVRHDTALTPFFHSHDGKLRKLRVETYGGASWLTEFSVLTGLSAFSLGDLRQFAQTIMAGKVRETLPQALARCGYRNVAFHPMLRIYLSIGKFFAAVGFNETFDAKDQGAKLANERDRFYYANALAEMERHRKASSQPLFIFIETMATHGPYGYTYMPEVEVPGGGAGTDPRLHEYLRRLTMARIDYEFLRAELSRRFANEQFLIVHYGDHHPEVTRALLGFDEGADFEQVMRSGNDAAFITYYVVDAVNFQPSPLPEIETLDVAYLGTIILEAGRVPLSDAYRERKRLLTYCNGRYFGCPGQQIPIFHRRLIDSGLAQ